MPTFIQFPRHALYEINTSFTPKHTNTLIQTKVIFISAKTNLWLKEVKQLSITVVFFLKFHLII